MVKRGATGELLVQLRQKHDFTQESLADATGRRITSSFIAQIETGRRLPSDTTIDLIAQTMGLDGSERTLLIEAKVRDKMEQPGLEAVDPRPVATPALSASGAIDISDLDDEDQRYVRDLVERFRDRR